MTTIDVDGYRLRLSWQDRLVLRGQRLARHGLWLRHGRPERLDTESALARFGLADEVHPDDAVAFLHQTAASLLAFERLNTVLYGHPTWTAYVPDFGWVAVLDLRPALANAGIPPTPLEPQP